MNIPQVVRQNMSWFVAYWLCMSILLVPLWAYYFYAVSSLYKERAAQELLLKSNEYKQKQARERFLEYLQSTQSDLIYVQNDQDPVYVKALLLLREIDPELVLMLGKRHDHIRDVMVTTRRCSKTSDACLQCLLLQFDASPHLSIDFGLGPHPSSELVEFATYMHNNQPINVDLKRLRYIAKKSDNELNLTLFDDALLHQDEWSKGFSDFEPGYKPSDQLLDMLLGEYMRKQTGNVSIKSSKDSDYLRAKPCLPKEVMQDEVGKLLALPNGLQLIAPVTYQLHTAAAQQQHTSKNCSWCRHCGKSSFYLNQYKQEKLKNDQE
ncbi:MAG: hypothetical protein IPK73_00160 [Candidatus Obscuribacter sp.]|nr:hypothetical protein [Candidatus Obscuribacter sp.]MBK9280589.1 hypothetical protein [Candidatus Obscuribacter sp.]MBL8084905.1 hypothetical protein [Candidatus Obscuribacter sp.]